MNKDKPTLIYIGRVSITFYKPVSRRFYVMPLKEGLLVEMSVTDEDAFALAINDFVKANSIELDGTILILSKDLLFVKTYKDMLELELDRENFITNIPFNPSELTFVEEENAEGAYSVAANRSLCVSLQTAFEKAGFDINGIIPDDIISTRLGSNSIRDVTGKEADRLHFLKSRSTRHPKYTRRRSGMLVPIHKAKNVKKAAVVLVPILAALIAIIVFVVIPATKQDVVKTVEDVTKESTESAVIPENPQPEQPVEIDVESPFALDSSGFKLRSELKTLVVDRSSPPTDAAYMAKVSEELGLIGFNIDGIVSGPVLNEPATILQYGDEISELDLYAITDYLYKRFDDVRKEIIEDEDYKQYDLIIIPGKILDEPR